MKLNRAVFGMVAAVLESPASADEKQERLDALEALLRDAASLAYDRMNDYREDAEARDFYAREWSALGCAADHVQAQYVARPVTPQIPA